MQNGVIIVEVFIVIAGHAYSITVLLIFHWHLYLFYIFQQQMGPGGVPVGAKTSEFYRTENVPNRFENPGL